MQRSDYKPPGIHPGQPVIISGDEPVEGTNYLGSSVSLNRLDGSSVLMLMLSNPPAEEQNDYYGK